MLFVVISREISKPQKLCKFQRKLCVNDNLQQNKQIESAMLPSIGRSLITDEILFQFWTFPDSDKHPISV
jgi:hypothetical protein